MRQKPGKSVIWKLFAVSWIKWVTGPSPSPCSSSWCLRVLEGQMFSHIIVELFRVLELQPSVWCSHTSLQTKPPWQPFLCLTRGVCAAASGLSRTMGAWIRVRTGTSCLEYPEMLQVVLAWSGLASSWERNTRNLIRWSSVQNVL